MSLEQSVSAHYSGIDLEKIGPTDEFHVGGIHASSYLFAKLGIKPGATILDAGCGTGGAARLAATTFNANVTGIDLTLSFIEKAKILGGADFIQASVLDMPFEAHTFDTAYTIHVGMNIRDKKKFYSEAARVLKPGGIFGIYDVVGSEPLTYPLPWASRADESFVITPDNMRTLLQEAGFEIQYEEDLSITGIESLKNRVSKPSKTMNLLADLESGKCRAYMMIGRLKA